MVPRRRFLVAALAVATAMAGCTKPVAGGEALVSDANLSAYSGDGQPILVMLVDTQDGATRLVTSLDAFYSVRAQGQSLVALGLLSRIALVDVADGAERASVAGLLVATDAANIYYTDTNLTSVFSYNGASGDRTQVWTAPARCKVDPPGAVSASSNTFGLPLSCEEAHSGGWNARLTLIELSSGQRNSHSFAREPDFRDDDRVLFVSPQGLDELTIDANQVRPIRGNSLELDHRRPAAQGSGPVSYIRSEYRDASPGVHERQGTLVAESLVRGDQEILRTSAFVIRDYDFLDDHQVVVVLHRR